MMKRFIFILLLATQGILANPTIERPLLYKATRDGKVAYIFGTSSYHSLTELPGDFKEKYLDPSAHILIRGTRQDFEGLFYPRGETLEEKLSPQSYRKLEEVVRNTEMEEILPYMRPSTVIAALVEAVKEKSAMAKNMDEEIEMEARNAGKLSYLDEFPNYITPILMSLATVDELEQYLDSFEDSSELFTRFYTELKKEADCYRQTDIPCLVKILYKPFGPLSEEEAKILADLSFKQRSATWIPTIEVHLNNTDSGKHIFISVPTSSLLTKDDNLLSLLRESGFTVEAVY